MMIFLYVLTALVIVIVVLLVMASTRPSEFRIERSARIEARPEDVFDEINDFRNWKQWSPWEELDPNMVTTYDGPDSGAGAKTAWSGNGKAGQGAMEILESESPNRVKIKLDFLKPFEAHNTTEFHLKAEGSATLISWQMYGKNNLISKVFGMFMNMDATIGRDFEEGFENLKIVLKNKA
jgi:hypothetical protein